MRWEFLQTQREYNDEEVKKILENCIYSLWFIYDAESEHIIHLAVMTLQGFSSSNIAQTYTHPQNFAFSKHLLWVKYSIRSFHLATHIDNESVNVKNIICGQFRTINACGVRWHARTSMLLRTSIPKI